MEQRRPDIKNQVFWGVLLFGFTVCYLNFVFRAGFWSDDALCWYLRGYLKDSGDSLGSYIGKIISGHLDYGRFFPITSIVAESSAHLLPLKWYKMYLCVLCGGCTVCFYKIILDIFADEALACLAAVFSVSLFMIQPHLMHSVFLCFGGNAILALLFCLLTTEFWYRYLTTRRKVWLGISFLTFELSVLTYEVAYLFILLYVGLALLERGKIKNAIKASAGLIGIFLANVGLYLWIKIAGTIPYDGTTVQFAPALMLRGALNALLVPIPFFSQLMCAGKESLRMAIGKIQIVLWCGILVGFAGILAFALGKQRAQTQDARVCRRPLKLAVLAGSLWILPALLMGVSEKYQQLPWGNGYVVVIFQYYGVGLLFAALWQFIWKKLGRKKLSRGILYCVCVSLGCGVILANQISSCHNIDYMEDVLRAGTVSKEYVQIVESFCESGFVDDLTEDYELHFMDPADRYSILSYLDRLPSSDKPEIDLVLNEKYIAGILPQDAGCARGVFLYFVEGPEELGALSCILKDGTGCRIDRTKLAPIEVQKGYCYALDIGDFYAESLEEEYSYHLGDILDFNGKYMLKGFSYKETDWTWTNEKRAYMHLRVAEAEKYDALKVSMSCVHVANAKQEITILVNGEKVYGKQAHKAGKIKFRCAAPKDGNLWIEISLPDAGSVGSDARELGIALKDMKITGIKQRSGNL